MTLPSSSDSKPAKNDTGASNANATLTAAGQQTQSNRGLQDANRRVDELESENRTLKQNAESASLLTWFACVGGMVAVAAGSATLIATFKQLHHGHSTLSPTDFIAGISGGCILILTVVSLFTLAIASSRRSTL
jgi:hypothetical protein